MHEEFNAMPSQPSDPIEQASSELTQEQEAELEVYFPDGAQTEEEKLLYNRIVLEMVTSPEPVDIEKIKENFLKEREEVLSKGGFDATEYSVDTSGIVTPSNPSEARNDTI